VSGNDAVKLVSHRNQLLQNASDGVSRPTGREYRLSNSFFTGSFLGCQCGDAPLTPDAPVLATGSSQYTSVQLLLLRVATNASPLLPIPSPQRVGAPTAPRKLGHDLSQMATEQKQTNIIL